MSFPEVQRQLEAALAANRPGAEVDHVLVVLPSYSVGESLLSHYAERVPALEHRYLVAQLILHRIERCQVIFVTCQASGGEVLDYYASVGSAASASRGREQIQVFEVPDGSARSVAAKLLDCPHLLDELRWLIADRPALIEPWNVTEAEVNVACRIGVPINGTHRSCERWGLRAKGAACYARRESRSRSASRTCRRWARY